MKNTKACENYFWGLCEKVNLFEDKETGTERSQWDYVAEFGRLFDYRDILLQINLVITCIIKITNKDDRKFFYGFLLLCCCYEVGFMNGCRKCIGFDGCFLKEVCKRQVFVAVAKDENNQIFSIAWVVTGVVKMKTWWWFMKILQDDLQLENGNQITLISDM